MSRFVFVKIALLLALVVATSAAQAQYVPYARGGYGGWGGWPRPSASYIPREAMAAQKGADRRQGLAQNFAQQQARNSFLQGQAAANSARINQTQQSRSASWTNIAMRQAEQNAARRRSFPLPAAGTGSLPLPPATTPAPARVTQSPAATGNQWPTLLNDSRFAVPREKLLKLIEAHEKSREGLTTAEYEEAIELAGEMKDVLREMASELNAAEYLNVQRFLDELIAKARAFAARNQ